MVPAATPHVHVELVSMAGWPSTWVPSAAGDQFVTFSGTHGGVGFEPFMIIGWDGERQISNEEMFDEPTSLTTPAEPLAVNVPAELPTLHLNPAPV